MSKQLFYKLGKEITQLTDKQIRQKGLEPFSELDVDQKSGYAAKGDKTLTFSISKIDKDHIIYLWNSSIAIGVTYSELVRIKEFIDKEKENIDAQIVAKHI